MKDIRLIDRSVLDYNVLPQLPEEFNDIDLYDACQEHVIDLEKKRM